MSRNGAAWRAAHNERYGNADIDTMDSVRKAEQRRTANEGSEAVKQIKCGKCKGTHGSIKEVRECHGNVTKAVAPTTQPSEKMANEKQIAFHKRLLTERGEGFQHREWTHKEISADINRLLALPKKQEDKPLQAGVYRADDGTVFRVYYGKESGRMLAKRVTAKDEQYDNGKPVYTMVYAGLASRFVNASQRMTLEEAKQWGKITESCCVCGRRLDDPDSVDAGIGPVCAGRMERNDWA